MSKPIYIPVFRVRQQESLVLRSFQFPEPMYPMIEIVKQHDRVRKEDNQKSFEEIYLDLIRSIDAKAVFVDLPVYLKETGSMNTEVLQFSRSIIGNWRSRSEYLLKLSDNRVIPVISSYLLKTGEQQTIHPQFNRLSEKFSRVAFRIFYQSFFEDWEEVVQLARPSDYVILDLDTLAPYPSSPVLRRIVTELRKFTTCAKIVLRSAINTDVQNVRLDHGAVIYEADNSLLETFREFSCDGFGDYAGIKKDDLTAGGTISPGFIYYDAVENQYYGFKASFKSLTEFESTIVPDVLASDPTKRMIERGYLVADNRGWNTINSISEGNESGKNQAKFKRVALEHYLFCIRKRISDGTLS